VNSISMIFCGMICLFGAVVAFHLQQTELDIFVKWAGGWVGGILVIVGTGKLFFLDE
jgi:hypothetical protein